MNNHFQYPCLSIAGFDSSGGAGIQADLKTFSALGCYGMTVLTALPVQNTCGIKSCYDLPLLAIEEQLQVIFTDIRPRAIKIGMLFSSEIIELVVAFLKKHAHSIPIIVDPVMVAQSGDALLQTEAVTVLRDRLLPLAELVTPNLPEAYALVGTKGTPEELGEGLLALGCQAVLMKGGHAAGQESVDTLMRSALPKQQFSAPRLITKNTHGTGCTLSAAIASLRAQGFSLVEACERAKRYLYRALQQAAQQSVGHGSGPVQHFYGLEWNDDICSR